MSVLVTFLYGKKFNHYFFSVANFNMIFLFVFTLNLFLFNLKAFDKKLQILLIIYFSEEIDKDYFIKIKTIIIWETAVLKKLLFVKKYYFQNKIS